MNCIALDDEMLALDLLEDYIGRVSFLKLIGRYTKSTDAIEAINNGKVELLFLDIQMPDITGLQLLKLLKPDCMVIFTTAYSNYALEGFNLKVIDYLLKPFAFDRFFQAVSKAHELSILKSKHIDEDCRDYIFVNSEHRHIRVITDEIIYIEGLKDYVKIYISGKEKHIITRMSLRALEDKLNPDHFFRVHKSYIISLQHINWVRNNVVNIGEKNIPIGDNFKDKFYKQVVGNKGKDTEQES
jgi:DNA-binding LytR/AlgR family response regulator